MNADIWVTSKLEKGGCFQFYIHLEKKIQSLSEIITVHQMELNEHNDSFSILLIEGNFVNQEVIIMTLQTLVLDDCVVENAQLAIKHLQTNNII